MGKKPKLKELKELLTGRSVEENLERLVLTFPGRIVFTTSLGMEDQVITHLIFSKHLDIKVATLDTGRLFSQTYDVLSDTIIHYNETISIYFPEYSAVEKMVTEKGPYSFYKSHGNRKECCRIRKVEPLERALAGIECWISGIRADQSENRKMMDWIEYDEDKNLFKYYPLFKWTSEEVKSFINEHRVPYNRLHDKGYASIGCEPCTRALKPGEDFRAGRWWWENDGPKECGLHTK